MTDRAVVLLSGGLDSTLCATMASKMHESVIGLSLIYGQKHTKEVDAAQAIAVWLGLDEHIVCRMPKIFAGALIDPDEKIPEISYEEIDGVSPTYVPFRNANFLSAAAAIALKEDASFVYFGAHSEDARNWAYPDCTPEFIGAMASAIYIGTYHKVRLITPLQWMTKAEIVAESIRFGSPIDLTWSCYNGHTRACGKCPTCLSRLEAFKANDLEDPIEYEEP